MITANVLGQVQFNRDGTTHTVSLHFDGTWTIEPAITDGTGPIFASVLEDISAAYTGPACGEFGSPQLRQAADFLKGKVTREPIAHEDSPGLIY